MTNPDLPRRFKYHAPRGNQVELYARNRERYWILAEYVSQLGSSSREMSLALTALEESLMWVNAHIARNDVGIEEGQA